MMRFCSAPYAIKELKPLLELRSFYLNQIPVYVLLCMILQITRANLTNNQLIRQRCAWKDTPCIPGTNCWNDLLWSKQRCGRYRNSSSDLGVWPGFQQHVRRGHGVNVCQIGQDVVDRRSMDRSLCFAPCSACLRNQFGLKKKRQLSPSRGFRRGQLYAMFTGIVEDIGTVKHVKRDLDLIAWDGKSSNGGLRLHIESQVAIVDCYKGCSVAVDGVCLTVTDFHAQLRTQDPTRFPEIIAVNHSKLPLTSAPTNMFEVDVAPETIRRTTLGTLQPGNLVNVERAAMMNSRNSGHQVQGHVDGRAEIMEMIDDGQAVAVKIKYPCNKLASDLSSPELIVEKGFISVDGCSLTVTAVNEKEGWFSVMLVPHTQTSITLPRKQVGDKVNIELDIMGKYVAGVVKTILPSLLGRRP